MPMAASMSDQDLEHLVRAAQAGGGWAFERIWLELSPAVAGYARARGVRDVDDVVSTSFLAVFQGLAGFRGSGGAFRSWVFTIAHHKIVDDVRIRQRRSVEQELTVDTDVPLTPSAETAALAAMSDLQVRHLLDQLTPDQRDVLLLRVFGDLPMAEVARALGRTEGAVKQLQHRALQQLRKSLAQGPEGRTQPADPVTKRIAPAITEMS